MRLVSALECWAYALSSIDKALASRDAYAKLAGPESALRKFLNSLILFPPDTASTLDPGNRNTPNFPQCGNGSIKLTVLFTDPRIRSRFVLR